MKKTILISLILILTLLIAGCQPTSTPSPTEVPTATTAPTAVPTTAPTEVPTATTAPTAVPTAEPTEIALVDMSGETVTLPEPAKRIVSIVPSNTELVFAIGAGDALVGRDDYSNYPPEAEKVQSIGSSMELNLEMVVSLEPDLVLAADLTAPEQVKAMRDLGLTVYQLPNPTDFESLYANILTLGTLTGKVDQAQALVDNLKARVSQIEETLKAAETTPLVFYELDATEPAKPWTAGAGTFVDMLITKAKGKNLGAELEGAWVQISTEELIAKNPQIIILGSSTYGGVTPEDVAARPGWSDIQAVKDNAVYAFNDDLVSRPGPRLVDGLEALAKLIHPELFK